jgi:hypothetical protein
MTTFLLFVESVAVGGLIVGCALALGCLLFGE